MKLPSFDNENPLTWRCKVFGCKDEELPGFIFQAGGEKHGIRGFSFATATATLLTYTAKGCRWCLNYRQILDSEDDIWPKWKCSCDICEYGNRKEVVIA